MKQRITYKIVSHQIAQSISVVKYFTLPEYCINGLSSTRRGCFFRFSLKNLLIEAKYLHNVLTKYLPSI